MFKHKYLTITFFFQIKVFVDPQKMPTKLEKSEKIENVHVTKDIVEEILTTSGMNFKSIDQIYYIQIKMTRVQEKEQKRKILSLSVGLLHFACFHVRFRAGFVISATFTM